MSIYAKYQVSRVTSLLAVIVISYCILQTLAPGMSGKVQEVKIWIGIAFLATSIGIGSALAMYYYRAKLGEADPGTDTVTTLAAAGRHHTSAAPPQSTKLQS